jgi:hypothetical protein
VRAVSAALGPLIADRASTGPVLTLPGAARRPGALGGGPGPLPGARAGGGGGGGAAAGPGAEPSPEAMDTLMSMGFDRARAAAALRRTGNDVQAAIAQLVS